MADTCKDCVFYMADKDEAGVCRRYPPTLVDGVEQRWGSMYLPVNEDYWCGEFIKQFWHEKEEAE